MISLSRLPQKLSSTLIDKPCPYCNDLGYINLYEVDDEYLVRYLETGDSSHIEDWMAEKRYHGGENGCSCHLGHAPCSSCENRHSVEACTCPDKEKSWFVTEESLIEAQPISDEDLSDILG